MNDQTQPRRPVYLDHDLHAQLKEISDRTGIKMQRLIDEAVRNYLRHYPLSQVNVA